MDVNLLQMSFAGGIMIIVVVLLRAVLIHRLPKRTFLILWSIVLSLKTADYQDMPLEDFDAAVWRLTENFATGNLMKHRQGAAFGRRHFSATLW